MEKAQPRAWCQPRLEDRGLWMRATTTQTNPTGPWEHRFKGGQTEGELTAN